MDKSSMKQQSAREDHLERENKHLKRENKRLRGIEIVVQSLAEKGGVDFDGIMQSAAADLSTSDSEGGIHRGRGDVHQSEPAKGMGSRTGGSTSHGDDDEDDYYGSEGDDDYGKDSLYGDEPYYGGEGYNDYEDEEYNEYGNDNDDWP
ncbi:stress protein DDR48-like isoform X11 [Triticum urartu]|uniref:stress protein DDR48-like isoform X6 n=1 Tax=Triticum urartu TaxID=4572 RepID=UPI002043DDA9|nr:stress protein DDR48-like isoform X6 [Triticum urartu]XP_048541249.1 stress protein DDR48-like isoform X11 [Triticum urartu]